MLLVTVAIYSGFATSAIQVQAQSQFSIPEHWCGTNCRMCVAAVANGGDSIGIVAVHPIGDLG